MKRSTAARPAMPALVAAMIACLQASAIAAERLDAVVSRRVEVILPARAHGLVYFPDAHITLLQTEPEALMLLVAGTSTWLMGGPDIESLSPVSEVLVPGNPGEFDNGYTGIFGVHEDPDTWELLAFYHAEDQEEMPRLPNGVPGFYASVGLAVSADEGETFRKLGPILTGSQPKDTAGRGDQGIGEGSVCVDHTGEYLLCYYSDHSRVDGRGVQICVARSPLGQAREPGAWRKYYQGDFAEPGLGGRDSYLLVYDRVRGDSAFPHVRYVPEIQRYIMVYCWLQYEDLKAFEPTRSGISLTFSHDGIHWAQPSLILRGMTIPRPGKELTWHPALVLERVDGVRLSGWLYYGYSERWGHDEPDQPHYLVRRAIDLKLEP